MSYKIKKEALFLHIYHTFLLYTKQKCSNVNNILSQIKKKVLTEFVTICTLEIYKFTINVPIMLHLLHLFDILL